MSHLAGCQALIERQGLIDDLKAFTGNWVVENTNEGIDKLASYARGVFAEYHDDGDQMAEACDCGHAEGKHFDQRLRDLRIDEAILFGDGSVQLNGHTPDGKKTWILVRIDPSTRVRTFNDPEA